MPNENDHVEVENNEEVLEVEESKEEEKPKEKKQFTPEEQLAIHKREAKKLEKQLGLNEESSPKSKEKASSETDYGQLAYLNSKNVPEEDHDYVFETAKESGKTIKDLMATKWFQADLAERVEDRTVKKGTPSSSKRSAPDSKDSLGYWVGKYNNGTPINEVPSEFRTKVIDARVAKEKDTAKFTDNSVIIGGYQA